MPIERNEAILPCSILFDEDEEKAMTSILNRAAKELASVLINGDVRAYFPKQWAPDDDGWGGKDVSDPLTVYLISDTEQKVLKKISLTKELEETIEMCEENGDLAFGLSKISEAMKKLAQRIDFACNKQRIDTQFIMR